MTDRRSDPPPQTPQRDDDNQPVAPTPGAGSGWTPRTYTPQHHNIWYTPHTTPHTTPLQQPPPAPRVRRDPQRRRDDQLVTPEMIEESRQMAGRLSPGVQRIIRDSRQRDERINDLLHLQRVLTFRQERINAELQRLIQGGSSSPLGGGLVSSPSQELFKPAINF